MKDEKPFPEIVFSRMASRIERPVIVELMAQALKDPDLLSLAAGFTDNEALPRDLVERFSREITRGDFCGDDPLQYGSNQGRRRLRELTCDWLSSHPGENDSFDPDDIVMTNGSQQMLYLAIQSLCDPGDIILVEDPSYFVCLEMLKGFGVRAIGIPCAPNGAIEPEGFADLLDRLDRDGERARVKGIYLVSYFSNPTGRCLGEEEKDLVAQILVNKGFFIPVIEDAAYRELYFGTPSKASSILSRPSFQKFPKLYLGTYTKPFATGLKVGYGLCTSGEWKEKILGIKGHQDFGSAHFNQAVIEKMLQAEEYENHLQHIRERYERKLKILGAELAEAGLRESGWSWDMPKGGLLLWLRGPIGFEASANSSFYRTCLARGVMYVPGDLCFADRSSINCIRLSTGAIHEERLVDAVTRFCHAINHLD